MKKFIRLTPLIAMMLFLVMCAGGKNPAKLVGGWERTSGNKELGDTIVLDKDGTGIIKVYVKYSVYANYSEHTLDLSWRVEKKHIIMFGDNWSQECEYTFSKDELTLKELDSTNIAVFKKLSKEKLDAIQLDRKRAELSEGIKDDFITFASNIQAYYKTPKMMGGGGGTFVADDLSKMMSFINNDSDTSIETPMGRYDFTYIANFGIRIEMKEIPDSGGWSAVANVCFEPFDMYGFTRGVWTQFGAPPIENNPIIDKF